MTMNATAKFIIGLLLALTSFALAQTAKTKPELKLESFLVITETKDGKTTERFQAASSAEPGQILEYRVTASNNTEGPVSSLNIELPIPKSTKYLEGSATNTPTVATLQASADNKRSFGAIPLKRKVIKDGKTVEELVNPNDYTNLRWVLKAPLQAKANFVFKARVKVK
jgi:uncharacterized repeat protein (TIGR01451 family)